MISSYLHLCCECFCGAPWNLLAVLSCSTPLSCRNSAYMNIPLQAGEICVIVLCCLLQVLSRLTSYRSFDHVLPEPGCAEHCLLFNCSIQIPDSSFLSSLWTFLTVLAASLKSLASVLIYTRQVQHSAARTMSCELCRIPHTRT